MWHGYELPQVRLCSGRLTSKQSLSQKIPSLRGRKGKQVAFQSHDLVGGWALPIWKIMDFVSWDYDIPNWMEKSIKIH